MQEIEMNLFSFGGGVQSTACMVLAAEGKIPYHRFVFANTGDDSEHPDTLDYIRTHHTDYAKRHGLELVMISRETRNGKQTLLESLQSSKTTIAIPMRMNNGAFARRTCTARWKIEVIAKYTKKIMGAHKKNMATIGIGISLDEFQRMGDSQISWQKHHYPLIDLQLDRRACYEIIRASGLPIPPKSACWFCPFTKKREWQTMSETHPDLFEKACQLEEDMNAKLRQLEEDKRLEKSMGQVWLHKPGVNLRDTINPHYQLKIADFLEDEECTGFCTT